MLSQKRALTMYLTEEVEKKLRLLQHTLAKERKEPMDWNTVMETLFAAYEEARASSRP